MRKKELFKILNYIEYQENLTFGEYSFDVVKMFKVLQIFKQNLFYRISLIFSLLINILLIVYFYNNFNNINFKVSFIGGLCLFFLTFLTPMNYFILLSFKGANFIQEYYLEKSFLNNFLYKGFFLILYRGEYTYNIPSEIIQQFIQKIREDYINRISFNYNKEQEYLNKIKLEKTIKSNFKKNITTSILTDKELLLRPSSKEPKEELLKPIYK